MWWVTGVVALLLVASAYLAWTAARVDRLHARAAAAAKALDAQLLRRAAAAAVLAEERSALDLYAVARTAIDARPDEREAAENDLTHRLRATPLPASDPVAEAVVAASRRLGLARQVHTDLVRDALAARRRPVVRVMRMIRKHEVPRYFDVDDPTISTQPRTADRPVVAVSEGPGGNTPSS
ncbi:MAG TPA: hypothetical protein VHN18_16535 [Micromonosporaceae bacterium]|nr:hypothetical protein [Micromonosporaceae bacterium]